MKSSKAPAKSVKVLKDGHGAHWHTVGWLAAVALVISASTMTLSASAQSTSVTPLTLLRGINDLKAQLTRLETKVDRLTTTCTSPNSNSASCPAPSANTVTNQNGLQERIQEQPQQQAPVNLKEMPTQDATKCRLSCEDEFNSCIKITPNEKAYEACKAPYENCWNKCAPTNQM